MKRIMKLSDLKEYPIINKLIKRIGDYELFPPQEEAIKSGFLKGSNLLLASPTSSGKTLIALIASLINHQRKGKTIYLVPLKSLAVEKHAEFSRILNGLMSVGLSIGDLTRSDEQLGNNDLIICSYEKFDSLMRHKARWINEATLTILDEIHLMDDINRGPVIEVLITRLKEMNKWIIGLSATIGNPEEVGEWFNAIVIKSNYRPVKLNEGLLFNNELRFKNKDLVISNASLQSIISEALNNNKQVIVFVNTRRSAESVAEKLSEYGVSNQSLIELSNKVLHALPTPTKQCYRLSKCVKKGVAFNHAGLISEQKTLIESAFRQGIIKIIVATTVLAYGVSLPANTVIIRDFKRFTSNGVQPISISEYLQMAGRAGRSGYEKEGYSVLITGSESEAELAWNNYLTANPPRIESKLGVEWVLRFHTLSLICDGTANTLNKIINFFTKTFFGKTFGEKQYIEEQLSMIISELIEWGFIKVINNKLVPTIMGLRVNELYLDPLSAHKIINGLSNYKQSPLGLIHLASTCSEVPNNWLKQSDYQHLLEELALNEESLLISTPSPFSDDYEYHLRALKTALIINDWINELTEDEIMSKYGLAPGSLYQLLRNIEWVLYSASVIARTMGLINESNYIKGLTIRVKYGVKSELLTLVSLKGIGKVKARKLYNNGFKNINLIKSNQEKVIKIIGEKTGKKLIKMINDDNA